MTDIDNDTRIYTVLYDGATIAEANQFIVADTATYDTGIDETKPYNIGTFDSDQQWQTIIPEPAVASLICIFGGGLLIKRRIFNKS